MLFLFLSKIFDVLQTQERGERMTQEELRELYNERLEKEKQTYISKVTGIDGAILSKFKNNKINLYPALFAKLENYLLNS